MTGLATLVNGARQLALIDAAELFADQQLSPSFQHIRDAFALIDVDLAAECRRLREVCEAARNTHNVRAIADATYEAESEEVRDDVDEIGQWTTMLGNALERAGHTGHPLAKRMHTLLLRGEREPESYRSAAQQVVRLMDTIEKEGLFCGLALPKDHIARGRALFDRLRTNRAEANVAHGDRLVATQVLHEQLREIGRILLGLEAVRENAALASGTTIVGFDFALLRAAMAESASERGKKSPAAEDEAPADALLPPPPGFGTSSSDA